jgi:hypothetical protein
MRLAGDVARLGEKKCAYRVFVEKPEGKIPLGRPMDLQEVGGVDWIVLVQFSYLTVFSVFFTHSENSRGCHFQGQ